MTHAEKWKRIAEIDAEFDTIAKRQTELSREKSRLLMTGVTDSTRVRVSPERESNVTMRELRKHYE